MELSSWNLGLSGGDSPLRAASPLRSGQKNSSNGGTVMEIMKVMKDRRKSAAAKTMNNDDKDSDEGLQSILLRIESDLKSHLAEMDQKLDRLCKASIPKSRPPRRASIAAGHAQQSDGIHTTTRNSVARTRSSRGSLDPIDMPEAIDAEWNVPASLPGMPVMEAPAHEPPSMPSPSPAWLKSPTVVFAAGTKGEAAVDKSGGQVNNASRIDDMIRKKITHATTTRSRLLMKAWQFLEEPDSSFTALCFSRVVSLLIVVNVALSLLSWSRDRDITSPTSTESFLGLFHLSFDILCATEVTVRFVASPRPWAFLAGVFNWVDTIAGLVVIPRLLWLSSATQQHLFMGEILHTGVPVVWLLKLLRNFEKFNLLCSAFTMAFEALPVLLFTLITLVLSFGGLIYLVEPRDVFEAPPRALWFTIVTMMTVGYGDITPSSSAGTMITSILMVGSQLYMAIPLGIVGGSFSRVWEDRDRLLLMRRTRVRLTQWGYTPEDLLELFYHYDTNKSGELDIHDFNAMMQDMKLGLTDERVKTLFKSLDEDCSGEIDYEEFLGAVFPGYAVWCQDSNQN